MPDPSTINVNGVIYQVLPGGLNRRIGTMEEITRGRGRDVHLEETRGFVGEDLPDGGGVSPNSLPSWVWLAAGAGLLWFVFTGKKGR